MTIETPLKSCTNLDIDAFDRTRAAVEADPSVGKGAFSTSTTWEDGARAETTARSFRIETDEPAPLGGSDAAVDPMELLLASLGTCLTIGWVTQARKRGVDFQNLKIDVEGDYDLRGYLALDEDVRPGFSALRYTVKVDTEASPDVLEEIRAAAERTSPMFDNIRNGAAIAAEVQKQG